MSEIEVDIVERIHRPIDDVFDRLADIDSYTDWMPDNGLLVSCRQDPPGPVDVGTVYFDRTKIGTVKGEVVEYERPGRLVFHYTARAFGRTAMEGWPGYRLEAVDGAATQLHHRAVARIYGAFRLLRPLVRRIARAERRRTVNALKASLEQGSA